ncbi:MAG: aminotransferase class I/II-fold pyridoxal phosphate-dependent enzyme [Clostridia bacterium]|nr:aminotransferase class I/II-fold pyridoxal phosphate-dependent enzyme [Clostridia bacterium]
MAKNQGKAPLWEAIRKHIAKRGTGFHTPGHQGGRGIDLEVKDFWGLNVLQSDLTEVPGLDSLDMAQGVIREAQQLAAELHGARGTHFLVNGTSAGIMAMSLAVGGPGKVMVVPRNCHVSVIRGLILSGSKPVFVESEVDKDTGLVLGVALAALEEVLARNSEAEAVLLVHPNYFGVCGPLEEQVGLCHRYGKRVLVDEAHGSHFSFHPGLPVSAMEAGADLCAQSYHKTLSSLTQSSLLHWGERWTDEERIKGAVAMVQSTSPSYLLMASLDLARRQMALYGYELWENTLARAAWLREEINKIKGFRCLSREDVYGSGFAQMDETRLVVTGASLGLSGSQLADMLRESYTINVEMAQGAYIVLIITPGTGEGQSRALLTALAQISLQGQTGRYPLTIGSLPPLPLLRMNPREAWFARHRLVSLGDSIGRVAAQTVAPCPPGIPVLIPGEEISPEIGAYLTGLVDTINIVDG